MKNFRLGCLFCLTKGLKGVIILINRKITLKKPWEQNASNTQIKTIRCDGCGRLIEKDKAYCVIKGPKKTYYCSQEEYDGGAEYIAKRNEFEKGIIDAVRRIVCYDQTEQEYSFDDGLFNTLLMNWKASASFKKIYYYLIYEEDRLKNLLVSKNISWVTTRLKYLSAVLLNNIVNYDAKRPGEKPIDQTKVYKDVDLDLYKPDLTPRKNLRRSMEDLEEEYGN